MPINSRQKGAAGERELAKLLENYGWESKRGQQHAGSPDSPDVISQFPWHIEGKRTEKTAPLKWMEKATEDAEGNKPPMIFWRPNRGQWMVMCWAGDLLTKLKEKETDMPTGDRPRFEGEMQGWKQAPYNLNAPAEALDPNTVVMPRDLYEAALEQAKEAGRREAIADMQGGQTAVEEFLSKVTSHPPMDDEEATKQAVAEKLRANQH